MKAAILGHRQAFLAGFVAGLLALAFNFLLRLGGVAPFPPESAFYAFLALVPASIEEPMVQSLGDFAGQLGLILATLVAAVLYGVFLVLFDRFLAPRASLARFSGLERLLVFSAVPWLFFGLLLFLILGEGWFGIATTSSSPATAWSFPFTLLLVQGVFALAASLRYSFPRTTPHDMTFGTSRRGFIEKGALLVLAVGAAIVSLSRLGDLLGGTIRPSGGSQPIGLQDAPAIFRDTRVTALVDSEVTPNESFYRVAIDVIDPEVDASAWTVAVDGLVRAPKKYDLQSLRALPRTSEYNTFECVSNKINGDLVGNAKWTGVKLSDLLSDVGGVQQGAVSVIFYSVDGYSVGVPIEKGLMSDSLLAYEMNDKTLPNRHGYPLRAVIPGLYGMMSAKWVNRISIVDSIYEGFWQTRGWTNKADVNTVAFIALPTSGSQVNLIDNAGSVIVAGYAYAGERGISKVEISVDGGTRWEPATLKNPISKRTWILWAYDWRPTVKGSYTILARATDGLGDIQTSESADTFPNGATGYAFVNSIAVV